MKFRTGDRVHQQHYGPGEIVEMNAAHVTVAFDDGTARKFAAERVQLQPSDVPRPARPAQSRKSKARARRPVGAAKASVS